MKYKTVWIFDFDGTIADTFPRSQKILRELVRKFNVPLNENGIEDYKAIWGRGTPIMIKHWFSNHSFEEVSREWQKLASNTTVGLIDNAKKAIQNLQRRDDIVGLLTNRSWKSLKRYKKLWEPLKFDFIQTLATKKLKPNPGCFKPVFKWLKKKRIKPKKIYYIGDCLVDFEAVENENLCYGYNIEFIGTLRGPIKTRREWHEMTGARFLILRSVADLPKWLEDREKEMKFNFKIKLF